MKRNGIPAILIMLFLAISTLAILSTSNSNISPILINQPQNNVGTLTKSYTGNGSQLNAMLYITNTYNNTPNTTNTTSNIYIPCPSGWKIIHTNLTLTNINAPNTTIESNYTNPNASLTLNESNLYAMSFRLTNNAYLDNICVQLYASSPNPQPPTVNFYVYNAENYGGNPRPLNQIASNTSTIKVPLGTNWINVSFGRPFLNISETYDNTFFIAIKKNNDMNPKIPEWNATQESSPPGNGYVYYFNGSNWLENQSYDCQLVVNVSASETSPAESVKPSDIGLTINGTTVSDINKGSGEWINSTASPVSNGYIFYDVNSTWMSPVSFSYVWNITILKDSYVGALTTFNVSRDTSAFWNITVNATGSDGFPLTNGVNHINITGTPADWDFSGSMVYNVSGEQWINLDSRPPDDVISFTAGNGTWILNCTAPNYVSDLDIMIGTETIYEKATLDEILNITVNFVSSITGTVNLSVYDSSQILNYTAIKPVNQPSASFTWNVSSTASPNNVYTLTIFFESGLKVGYTNRLLEIVLRTPTFLTVISCPTEAMYPSYVPVTLYYNDTQNNQGIPNASITAWEGSRQLTIHDFEDYGNGTYKLNVELPRVFGVHNIHFSATKRLYNSSGTIPISVNYLAPTGWMFTDINPLLLVLISNMTQQNQNLMGYLLIGVVLVSAAAAAVVVYRLRRKSSVPINALASLENIIVDHASSGVTMWAFDFLRMEQDVNLVSGFMSAVKSFLVEMRKGGLRRMDTEFGTFIREDGELLAITCITSGSTQEEEKWIRGKLQSFVNNVEQQNWDMLANWSGEVSPLRPRFFEALSSLIDLDKAEQLQRERFIKVLRRRERLQVELNNLGTRLEALNQQLSEGKISQEEFEARKAEIEPKYDKVQMDYIRASILVSKVPYTLEAAWEKPEAKEEMEKIRDKFVEITMEIGMLQRKAQVGRITSKELKRKEILQRELMTLIEKLDKVKIE